VVIAALAALLAAASGAAEPGRGQGAETVPALAWHGARATLGLRDALTLAPVGRPVGVGRAEAIWARSPDGRSLALASSADGLVVLDLRALRVAWRLPRGRLTRALAWVSPRRLLVVEHAAVLHVDPVAHRVVARSDYEGTVLQVEPWRRGIVILVSRDDGQVGPARLVVVGAGIQPRTVELPGILAGVGGGEDNQGPWRSATPALAVDPSGRAFVVGGNAVGTVDLASGSAAVHEPMRLPQKVAAGPVRSAAWLGGALAVSGYDLSIGHDATRGDVVSGAPHGLRYVRGDAARVVDPAATQVKAAAGLALVYGNEWWRGAVPGRGLRAYGPDGALRWHALPDAAVESVTVVGGRVYALAQGRWHVVDVARGRVLASPPAPASLLLLGR
jgi:hypothetical protein